MKTWLLKDKLQMVHAFLDVVEVVECLQFLKQAVDKILDVEPLRDATLTKIKQMLQKPKSGGFEAKFSGKNGKWCFSWISFAS